MASAEKKEVLWINTLKGGCILLVVLHHTIITTFAPSIQHLTAGIMPAEMWVAFNKHLSPLRMPAFFFVSGLLAASAITKKSWSEVFTKKFSNILYLYILWGVIQWVSIHNISANLIGEKLSSAKNAAYAESPVEFIKLLVMSMTSLWYLYALAGYFVIAKLFHRQKYALLLAAVAVNYATQFSLIPGWGPASVSQNFIYFLTGAFLSHQLVELSFLTRRNALILGSFFVLGLVHHVGLGLNKNLFYCLLSIVFGIVVCRALNNRFNMGWLNWIGRNTLQIYVLHRIFIELLGLTMLTLAIKYELFSNTAFSVAWALTLPVLAVAFCTVISLMVWMLLNRGPGRALFLYPRLMKKPQPVTEAPGNH
ncbi:acyltransferase family protein [Erwinia sp. 9145]|uniref:acyltransferase family protein n=1 Tax=Erwinia sp. 9145 TaxID=1500895 RepID=UPI00055376C7|nr:acyltransferase family protein [Erwinia sp. 9145]